MNKNNPLIFRLIFGKVMTKNREIGHGWTMGIKTKQTSTQTKHKNKINKQKNIKTKQTINKQKQQQNETNLAIILFHFFFAS